MPPAAHEPPAHGAGAAELSGHAAPAGQGATVPFPAQKKRAGHVASLRRNPPASATRISFAAVSDGEPVTGAGSGTDHSWLPALSSESSAPFVPFTASPTTSSPKQPKCAGVLAVNTAPAGAAYAHTSAPVDALTT